MDQKRIRFLRCKAGKMDALFFKTLWECGLRIPRSQIDKP